MAVPSRPAQNSASSFPAGALLITGLLRYSFTSRTGTRLNAMHKPVLPVNQRGWADLTGYRFEVSFEMLANDPTPAHRARTGSMEKQITPLPREHNLSVISDNAEGGPSAYYPYSRNCRLLCVTSTEPCLRPCGYRHHPDRRYPECIGPSPDPVAPLFLSI